MNQPNSPLLRLVESLQRNYNDNPLYLLPNVLNDLYGKRDSSEEISPDDVEDQAVAPIGFTRSPSKVVERSFGFIDMADFTETVARMSPDETTVLLQVFRSLVREVAAARGVRILRWLGDGVLLVGVETAPVAATVVEITSRMTEAEIPVCSGVTVGEVIVLDGDDYVGTATNLSARLSDIAKPGQVLCSPEVRAHLPRWIVPVNKQQVKVKGLGKNRVYSLVVADSGAEKSS